MLGMSLLMGGLQAAGSLLGGFGREKAAKKAKEEELAAKREYNAEKIRLARQTHKRAQAAAKVPLKQTTVVSGAGRLGDLVRDAEANGFNPLTVLRSGGQAYYAQTMTQNVTTGHNAMTAAMAGSDIQSATIPVFSSTQVPDKMEAIGGAIQSGASAFQDGYQQYAQQNHQTAMLNAQLAGAQRPGASRASRFLYTPTASGASGGISTGGNAVLSSNPAGSNWWDILVGGVAENLFLKTPKGFDAMDTDQNRMCAFGYCLEGDPNTSTAATVSDLAGEPAEWIWTPVWLTAAINHTWNKTLPGFSKDPQGWAAAQVKSAADYIWDLSKNASDSWNFQQLQELNTRDPYSGQAPRSGFGW